MSKLSKFFSNKRKHFKTQIKNNCKKCGRFRGFIGKFGLCRICIRFFLSNGRVPGYTKSSW